MGHTNITNSLKLFSQTFLQTLGVQLTKNPKRSPQNNCKQQELKWVVALTSNSWFFPNGSVCFDVLTKHCISDISLESLEVS